MDIVEVPIDNLEPHPANANVMDPGLHAKLAGHLKRTGRYPPIIVRPHGKDGAGRAVYQILDGHHRVAALKQIGQTAARCVVWEVDDGEALLLLATLNRLAGQDDPRKRAALVAELNVGAGLAALAAQLPEDMAGLESLMRVHEPPAPRPPQPLERMPVAVHFFLLPEQKRALDACLKRTGGTREEALMRLVKQSENTL